MSENTAENTDSGGGTAENTDSGGGTAENTDSVSDVMTESYHGGKFFDIEKKTLNAEKLGTAYTGLLQSHLKKTNDLRDEIKAESLKGRPEEESGYQFKLADDTLPEGVTHQMDDNDPTLTWFKGVAHKQGFTNDEFNSIVNQYVGSQVKQQFENTATYGKAEMVKLGERGVARVEAVEAWVKGAVSEKAANALVGGIKDSSGNFSISANVVEALEEIMAIGKADMSLPAADTVAQIDRTEFEAETRAIMRTPEYLKGDKAAQDKVAARFKLLYPGTTSSDRRSGFRR